MQLTIQRGAIKVQGPSATEIAWIEDCFEVEEIWRSFAMAGADRGKVRRALDAGAVVAVIKEADADRAIGFVIVYPPSLSLPVWEFSFAIVNAADRNAFAAIGAADAMSCYLFEHLKIGALAWRIRQDNPSSAAVMRRMGYQRRDELRVGGFVFDMFCIGADKWHARRARLERTHQSEEPLFLVTDESA